MLVGWAGEGAVGKPWPWMWSEGLPPHFMGSSVVCVGVCVCVFGGEAADFGGAEREIGSSRERQHFVGKGGEQPNIPPLPADPGIGGADVPHVPGGGVG